MPNIDIDLDVEDFLFHCSKRDIQNVIKCLRSDGYLEEEPVLMIKRGIWETEFSKKLDSLKERYFSIENQDMKTLEYIFNKYNM
jgi:precorrin-4 methylase